MHGEAKRGGGFKLAGSVASGKGHLEFDGAMDERGVVDVKILGQNFLAADIPAAKVDRHAGPGADRRSEGLSTEGRCRRFPCATINLQKLPQDSAAGRVAGRGGDPEWQGSPACLDSARQFPLTAVDQREARRQDRGDGISASTRPSPGQLPVRESPGVPTTGSGQLTVAGRYKAYGQDLTIKDGRLLFAGTPLDNPRLSIVAMREITQRPQDRAAHRRLGAAADHHGDLGSERRARPMRCRTSSPGRSLYDVGSASGSSQDALASATRSLEGAGAGLVAKRIGARLGLDEAGVEENEMIGGSALTIGEYLSPRLYLSYGVGLFEPGEVIALRYKLSDDVGVSVQRGTEETRAGIEYRIEK